MSTILIKQLILVIKDDGIFIRVDPSQTPGATVEDVRDELYRREIINADIAKIAEIVEKGSEQLGTISNSIEKYDRRKDKLIQVRVSDEGVHAYLTMRFSNDMDLSISESDVKYKLWEANVRLPFDEGKIKAIIQKKETVINEIVSTGTPPVHGVDGWIEYKVEVSSNSAPLIKADGSVDYHQINLINCIKKSQHLAHLVPATDGKPGTNVFGDSIPNKPGKNEKLPRGLNTYISPDELDLFAKRSGILYTENGLLNVEPVYVVSHDVDFSTGDIHYSGEVIVNGDIMTGFAVETDGNILVRGSVDGATVKSRNGDIVINGGILGKYKAVLEAKKNISAEFAQHSKLKAGGDVEVRKYLLDCEVEAGGIVKIPQGQIIGGTVCSETGILAREIGSPKNVKTQIMLGQSIDTSIWMDILQLNKKIKDLRREHEGIAEQVSFLEVLEKRLKKLSDEKQKELTGLRKKSEQMGNQIELLETEKRAKTGGNSFEEFPTIQANSRIYPGVVLQMNQFVEELTDPMRSIKISLTPNGVEKKALA